MNVLTRLLATAALIGGLGLGAASPASATGELGLSWDGTSWHPRLDGQLFSTSQLWVPGDTDTQSLLVRNRSQDPATLVVEAVADGFEGWLGAGDLMVQAKIGSGDWVGLTKLTDGFELTSDLPSGESTEVDVRAVFDAASTNWTQDRSVRFDFAVTLSQATTGDGDTGEDEGGDVDDTAGELPGTGAPVIGPFLLGAAILIGIGLGLLARRRRTDDEEVANA